MKIALVADWLTNYGGAESVISAFHDLYPEAPVYTTMYKPSKMKELGHLKKVHTSWLNKIPGLKHQWSLSFMPLAIEQFNLDEFDVVLSSCHSISKGVITKPETLHVSYCHTPMRYAWESWDFETRLKRFPRFAHGLIRNQIKKVQKWDYCAAQRVDQYIANSSYTASQIQKYYKRESHVINPPVRLSRFHVAKNPKCDYYLAAGRLIPYKKFDLLVEAFNQNKRKLKIVGVGPDYKKIKQMAKSNVEILGRVSDQELSDLYANTKAFLFPQVEDAGIVPLEAMASGRPVIAYKKGGSLDTVIENKTGIFFDEQTASALNQAINHFEKIQFDSKKIRLFAESFDTEVFKKKIKDYVDQRFKEYKN